MRLDQEKAVFLKNNIQGMKPGAQVMLFGSRTDDQKKGGDIDILVLSQSKLSLSELLKIQVAFWKKFGEQKLDIVSFTFQEKDTFKEIALSDAIEL
ncbi:MAG: nucleotidyltransferase domain-containing protein [Saprospiraceae bacterium]|nr:MAG: nucleotidyltransferase domain-containing protein [Saprospiraceae bacterium]